MPESCLVPGLDGEIPVKRPARRGWSVSYKNRTLLSIMDPEAQAERVLAGVTRAERTLYFCPSPLLGYGLETLLSFCKADSALLCMETDGKLLELSLSSIGENILRHPRFMLCGPAEGPELCRLVREKWGMRVFRRVETVKLSAGWQLDGAAYEGLADFLRRAMALEWGNAMTLVRLGRRFMRNAIRNLAVMGRSRSMTEPDFGSAPVLVLGAGPSLDTALDGLERAGLLRGPDRARYVMVCVDTCLSALRERKIAPGITVILESQFWNQRDFTGLKNWGIPAALDISAYPSSAEILGGPVYFFCTPWTELRFFDRLQKAGLLPPVFPPLGSVGLTAVELGRRISSGPVICAGIDFSFTPEAVHARSSPAHLAALASQSRFMSLLDINAAAAFRQGVFDARSKPGILASTKDGILASTKDGTPVPAGIPVKSNPAMRTYRDLFEEVFSGDRRIRDIEGSGLPLGLQTLSIEEAAALLGASKPAAGSPEPAAQNGEKAACEKSHKLRETARFVEEERTRLELLKKLLTGESGPEAGDTETLLDELDYLWAHFPDCAGAGGRRPPAADMVFLKRVRAEIDPFLRLWDLTAKEIAAKTVVDRKTT